MTSTQVLAPSSATLTETCCDTLRQLAVCFLDMLCNTGPLIKIVGLPHSAQICMARHGHFQHPPTIRLGGDDEAEQEQPEDEAESEPEEEDQSGW